MKESVGSVPPHSGLATNCVAEIARFSTAHPYGRFNSISASASAICVSPNSGLRAGT